MITKKKKETNEQKKNRNKNEILKIEKGNIKTNKIIKIIGFKKNMAATDGQIILAASRFGDTVPIYLR